MKKSSSVRKNILLLVASGSTALFAVSSPAEAGVTYKDGDRYLKVGGRLQVQYHQVEPEAGTDSDELFFRRFRPFIEGSIHPDWKGKFQWDMGKSDLAVKDAYMQYSGLDAMKITVGNANFPFSRELLTSSKKQQLVERTFVGDHNYGTPDRNAGIHLTGHATEGKKLTWGASLASANIDPDDDKLDFDTPVNIDDDFNEGWMVGGRVDFHPFGQLEMSQGDFKRDLKATIGVGAYTWNNDDDNNTRTTAGFADDPTRPDVDSVTGMEVSGAFRGAGFSVDAEYNVFNAETVDPTVTSGIYRNGETELKNYAVEAGYMVVPSRLELVAGYQVQDADNYADEWTRTSV
ncbi:MAG: porin, partial [Desulfurivibrionaceae bacterium]|nr:porin [Desulfurivibrionaceae bacterium]